MIAVEDIKGIKGLYAFKAMQTLLFAYFLLPEFRREKETYKDFLIRFSAMTDEEKREVFKTSLYFAGIDEKEILALICFAKDVNGIPYQRSNAAQLSVEDLFNIIIDVCMCIVSVQVFF